MDKNSTNNKIAQEIAHFSEIINAEHKRLNEQEQTIISRIAALGYRDATMAIILQLVPNVDQDADEAEQLLSIQDDIRDHLEQKEYWSSAILVEQSKLHEVVEAAEKLLCKEGNFYQRGGSLVHIVRTLLSPKNSKNKLADATINIKVVNQLFLALILTRRGNFVKWDGSRKKFIKIDCTEKIAGSLLAKCEWALPVLTGIIHTPTLRQDGSILDEPGYDPISGLYFSPGNCSFEKVPEYPTPEEVQAAKADLLFLLRDFPFEDEVSRSVAFAAILTALIRKSLTTAPLFGFTAPTPATGKTLLADVISLIATGKSNQILTQSGNETEEKKRLLALLMEGATLICYDNIEDPLRGATLCAILTAESTYQDRKLGSSETRIVDPKATFLVTGNNLKFAGDISSRVLLCTLDPQEEHPEQRKFGTNLRTYIPQNRGRLVKSALTILRAHYAAEKPQYDVKDFRFKDWNHIIACTIIGLGMADPCESSKTVKNADPINMLLTSFFYSWYEVFGEKSIKAKDLINLVQKGPLSSAEAKLSEDIQEFAGNARVKVTAIDLAGKLRTFQNRMAGGLRLEAMGLNQGTMQWRVKKITKTEVPGDVHHVGMVGIVE